MKRLRLIVAALAATTLSACGAGAQAAATVDGHAISTSSVEAASSRYAGTSAFKQQAQQSSGDQAERTFQQSWLSRLIRARVLGEEAAKRGIKVSSGEIDQQIQQIKQANFKTEADYRKALAAQGLTEPVLRQLVRQSIVEQRLKAAVTKNVGPSTAQLKRIYRRNIESYKETRSSQILVKSNGLAQTIYRRLRGLPAAKLHKEFAKLAAKYSMDKTSAKQGGDIGFSSPGQLVPQYEQAMANLKVGELSPPVRSQFGFHIILVTGRRTQSFAQVRTQIAGQTAQSEQDAAWNHFLRSKFEAANIEVNPAYGRLDPATQQVINVAAGDVPGTDRAAPTAPTPTPVSAP